MGNTYQKLRNVSSRKTTKRGQYPMKELVPESFQVPEEFTQPEFVIKKLCYDDTELDYAAVMSSIDIIRQTRGGDWPSPDLTYKDDLIDLGWHQREFENKTSFAYTVLDSQRTKCIGCLYFYPPGYRTEKSQDADVDASYWVTQEAYDQGLYPKLFHAINKWVKDVWPFKSVYWSNSVISQDL